jgi:gamma-glutamylputrescine oxidase
MNHHALSYWEQQSFIHYDTIIIGSGLVGLHTAIALKKQAPKQTILIVEQGVLPTGASTKNAGFACMGSVTELLADLQHSTADEVIRLFDMRQKGLADTRQLLGDAAIDYASNGSYELLTTQQLIALNSLEMLNTLLHPVLKHNAFTQNNTIIASNKFDTNYFAAAIQNNAEAQLHTGKLVKALLHLATSLGVEVRTGCAVHKLEETTKNVNVLCKYQQQSDITFTAHQVICCTNAFTKTLLPDTDITPGRGQIIITKPIPNLHIKGIYHLQEGYYYFRELNGRILFGGGRNLDTQTEATTDFAPNPTIISHLTKLLRHHILPSTPFEIDYSWCGIMAFGSKNKNPIITNHSDKIFLAVRCGGMGVAIGSQIAQQIVALVLKHQ